MIINSNSELSRGLSDIVESLLEELADDLYHFKVITIEQVFFALHKVEKRGILCIKVFQKLQTIGNKTSIVTIMKGLLTPKEHRDVEAISLAKAQEETRIFLKDVDFLNAAIKKGPLPASTVKKYDGVIMKVIIENLREFRAAKGRLESMLEKSGADGTLEE